MPHVRRDLNRNDSPADIARAHELSQFAHATVFTGLFFRKEIAAYYEDHGLEMPYEDTARRKIMPEQAEQRILDAFEKDASWGPLFRKTSCGGGVRARGGRLQRALRHPRAV
ncbi:hypothetical protein EES43_18350 [Streptomyces sp. ADI96-02]|nr:hypothetical protein EES43_18350 [Streptomyces sp. ADI96-02]